MGRRKQVMNLNNIDKKLLFDDRIVAVAGLTEPEKEILTWLRECMKAGETEKELTMPGNVATLVNEVITKMGQIIDEKKSFFGFEVVRQLGKEHFYIMDSSNKIVGRIQYVDDKV